MLSKHLWPIGARQASLNTKVVCSNPTSGTVGGVILSSAFSTRVVLLLFKILFCLNTVVDTLTDKFL